MLSRTDECKWWSVSTSLFQSVVHRRHHLSNRAIKSTQVGSLKGQFMQITKHILHTVCIHKSQVDVQICSQSTWETAMDDIRSHEWTFSPSAVIGWQVTVPVPMNVKYNLHSWTVAWGRTQAVSWVRAKCHCAVCFKDFRAGRMSSRWLTPEKNTHTHKHLHWLFSRDEV